MDEEWMKDVWSSWSERKFSHRPHRKYVALTFECGDIKKQSTLFICITYQGKQNGTVLLTSEEHSKQPEWKQILDQTITVTLTPQGLNTGSYCYIIICNNKMVQRCK